MNRFSGSLKALFLATALTTALGGCAAAALGGAAVGAGSIADRRSGGAQADDQVMELRVYNNVLAALKQNNTAAGFTPRLSVVSYNRRILLLGQVAGESDRQLAENMARNEANAQAVYNHIQILPENRTITNISSDTWITSKLRSRLLAVPGVYPGHVKVVTFGSTVYAMGILTPAEQAAVTEKIRTTTGVQQVITLYENYETAAQTSGSATQTPTYY